MKKNFDIELLLIIALGTPAIINTYLNLNIPFVLYFIAYLITAAVLLTINRKKIRFTKIKLDKEHIFVLSLVLVLFITRFLSVIKFTAPPLHDPVTHAYYARTISDSGMVNFFYSPLLHSSVAFINQLTKLPIPKLIIVFNSILLIAIPINIYLITKKIYKNKIFSTLAFIAITVAPSPNNLFYTAGKNSFIFGLLISIISFWYLLEFIKNNQKKDLLKLVISLVMLFFCHYPTFGITFLVMLPILFKNLSKFFNKKIILTSVILIITSSTIIFSWYINKVAPSESLGLESSSKLSIISGTEIIDNFTIGTNKSLDLIVNNLNINRAFFLLLLIAISLVVPAKNKKISLFLIGLIFTWLILVVLKTFTHNFIIHDTFLIFITPIFYVLSSIILATLVQKTDNPSTIMFLVVVFFLFKQVEIGNNYRKIEYQLDPVSPYDLEAFNFISKNMESSSVFLSANQLQTNENERVVFATDSALWLPVYTNSKIATPFWDFASDKSDKFSKITKEIIEEKKDDSKSFKELKENGIEYIYLDKGIFGGGLSKEYFNNVTYQSIFKNNEVEILKI